MRGTEPPTTASTNSNPPPGGSGLDAQLHDRELAVTAGLLLELALRLRGLARSSRGTRPGRGRWSHARRARARAARRRRRRGSRRARAGWSRRRLGRSGASESSASSRASAVDSFASSDCVAGARLTAYTGCRCGSGAGRAVPCGRDHSSDPDGEPTSFATAPTSPVRSASAGRCWAPRSRNSAGIRSSAPGRGVAQPVARAQRPRQHLEHRDLADERVGHRPEDVDERLAVGVRRDAHLAAAIAVRGRRRRRSGCRGRARRRRERAQQIGDAVDPGAGRAPSTGGPAPPRPMATSCASVRSSSLGGRLVARRGTPRAGRRRARRSPRSRSRAGRAPRPRPSAGSGSSWWCPVSS